MSKLPTTQQHSATISYAQGATTDSSFITVSNSTYAYWESCLLLCSFTLSSESYPNQSYSAIGYLNNLLDASEMYEYSVTFPSPVYSGTEGPYNVKFTVKGDLTNLQIAFNGFVYKGRIVASPAAYTIKVYFMI